MAGGLLVAGATAYLACLGAATSWQYYLSVDEAVADCEKLSGTRVRVSGRVAAGSLSMAKHRQEATFDLAGETGTLRAHCRCWLPDNFAEGIDVVVEGTLESNAIHGQKVITRCASKYESEPAEAVRDESLTDSSA
jgi:cytochrome c-type biogenesis protein CcmE